ncbi:MAG: glycosyltransferase family 9 protein [Fimbriimonadaceae bacterium]|nr:glycosyltransferase family 9 protein [Chitinophagales bacterium]
MTHKKILILRFSSIGDIVLTTPVVRCLKTQFENVEIHYATKKQYQSILSANPHIDKIHVLENSLNDLISKLRKEKFDFIIDLHHNIRTVKIKWALCVKNRSFNKLNIEKWLIVNFKINRLPALHIVDRYLATATPLGIINDGAGLDYFIPEKDNVEITSLPLQFQKGYVCVVIGAMHFTKKLPVEKLIELCNKISQPVILIGGKEDYNTGELIAQTDRHKIFNSCGKYSINQSASIIQQAQKVFTHDTGMMHIAAAFQKDIISIWGNTIPEFGMYPYFGRETNLALQKQNNKILEVEKLYCRPCSKIGYGKCPEGHFKCMRQINFDSLEL